MILSYIVAMIIILEYSSLSTSYSEYDTIDSYGDGSYDDSYDYNYYDDKYNYSPDYYEESADSSARGGSIKDYEKHAKKKGFVQGTTASTTSTHLALRLDDCSIAYNLSESLGCFTEVSHSTKNCSFWFNPDGTAREERKGKNDRHGDLENAAPNTEGLSQAELIQQARERYSAARKKVMEQEAAIQRERQRQQEIREMREAMKKLEEDRRRKATDKKKPPAGTAASATMRKKASELSKHLDQMKKLEESLFDDLAFGAMEESIQSEEEKKKKAGPQSLLNRTCQVLACDTCNIIVEDFSVAISDAVYDETYERVSDVLGPFCSSPILAQKYLPPVQEMCLHYFANITLGYKDALLSSFDDEAPRWENVAAPEKVLRRTKKVCLTVGACREDYFKFGGGAIIGNSGGADIFERELVQRTEEHRCAVCHAFASRLEGLAALSNIASESADIEVIKQRCDLVHGFGPKERLFCQEILLKKQDFSFLLNDLRRKIKKRVVKTDAQRFFRDRLCEDVKFCDPPVAEKEFEVEPEYF